MLRCRQSLPLALMRTSITKGSELNATGNRRQLMRTPKLLTLRATPGEWGWSRQTMCPLDQPNKSSARNLSSRATSGAGGASCEHESLPGYGGMCFQCKKVHWIPRTRQAENEARKLLRDLQLRRTLDYGVDGWVPGDQFGTDPLCNPGPGRMLGVLVCQRPAEEPGGAPEEVVLRAFSGQVGEPLGWEVDGWVGPLQTVTGSHPSYIRYREVIQRLNKRVAALEDAVTASGVALGSTSSSDPAQVFLREQLRNALDLRRSCSHELLDIVQRSYVMTNAAGKTLPLHEIWANYCPDAATSSQGDSKGPGALKRGKSKDSQRLATKGQAALAGGLFTAGAGDCAAPKLLAAAYAQGLRPQGLAEVWFGAPSVSRVVTKKHSKTMARMERERRPHVMTRVDVLRAPGQFYPCCDKCSRILGWQLCRGVE